MYTTLDDFLIFYKKFLSQSWNDVGPQEYVVLLLTVGLVGWYLMRKGASM